MKRVIFNDQRENSGTMAIPITFGLQSIGSNILFANSVGGNVVEVLSASLSISAKAKGEKFDHFWNKCVGAGRANEGLRTNCMAHLALVHNECGFRYLRFHGLFHEDMFVYHEVRLQTDSKGTLHWRLC